MNILFKYFILCLSILLGGCIVTTSPPWPKIEVRERIGTYSSTSYPTYKVNISRLGYLSIILSRNNIQQERFYIDLRSTEDNFEYIDNINNLKYIITFDDNVNRLILKIKNRYGDYIEPDGYSILRREY